MTDDCIHSTEWYVKEADNPLVWCPACGIIEPASPAWIAQAGLCVSHRVTQKLKRIGAPADLFSAPPQRSRTRATDEVGA